MSSFVNQHRWNERLIIDILLIERQLVCMVLHISSIERQMNTGMNNPFLVTCSDEQYVMKARNESTVGKALFNELVAAKFANLIDLPVPPFKVGNLENRHVCMHESLKSKGFECGPCFLSKYVKGTALKINRRNVKIIKNFEDVPKLILFDVLLMNTDRGSNCGNWFFTHDEHLIAIDHTNIFRVAQVWDRYSLQQDEVIPPQVDEYLNDESYNILMEEWIRRNQGKHHPFDPTVRKIRNLSFNEIDMCFKNIPDEWGVSDSDRNAAESFVLFQQKHIDDLLLELNSRFHLNNKNQRNKR